MLDRQIASLPGPLRASTLPGQEHGRLHYDAEVSLEIEGEWFVAECQLSRFHPVAIGCGKSLETALANLDRRLNTWRH
jgi:hypothetical protein